MEICASKGCGSPADEACIHERSGQIYCIPCSIRLNALCKRDIIGGFGYQPMHKRQHSFPRVRIPKLLLSTNEIIDTKAEDRKMGWFMMFPMQKHPTLICGQCHEICSLIDHKVDPNGKLSPSIVCPDKECGWHVFGMLEDWEDIPTYTELQLRAFTKSSDPVIPELANEVLTLRAKAAEGEPGDFTKMLTYAIIGLNMGHTIAVACKRTHLEVKQWALGVSRPHPGEFDKIEGMITQLISIKLDKENQR